MSKALDLLRRLASGDNRGDFFISNELLKEIEAALAQPEQEPVAWMYDHHIEVGYDKYTEFNIVETCARNLESENCINVRPLYLAPPKREPLTPRQGLAEYKRGYARAELDLKREPLSDEAVGEMLMGGFSTHLMDLVRMVEKAHGIGGEG